MTKMVMYCKNFCKIQLSTSMVISINKKGLGRTVFAWVGPFLTDKMGPTWTKFDGQERSGGPLLGGTIFAVNYAPLRTFILFLPQPMVDR